MSLHLVETNIAKINLQTFLDVLTVSEKIEVCKVEGEHLVTEREHTRILYSCWQNRARSILHEQLQASMRIVTAVTASIECSIWRKKNVYSCTDSTGNGKKSMK
jgi:hypothetical protein